VPQQWFRVTLLVAPNANTFNATVEAMRAGDVLGEAAGVVVDAAQGGAGSVFDIPTRSVDWVSDDDENDVLTDLLSPGIHLPDTAVGGFGCRF